jgi:hypothetical protein
MTHPVSFGFEVGGVDFANTDNEGDKLRHGNTVLFQLAALFRVVAK